MATEYKLELSNRVERGEAVGNLYGVGFYVDGRRRGWALPPQPDRALAELFAADVSRDKATDADRDAMRAMYGERDLIPTSTNADIALIRMHIAYWAGPRNAGAAAIKPSRGHTYRVGLGGHGKDDRIVRIHDELDYRAGVAGWRNP